MEGDAWASREFHVKWRRWSYIHCSWDTRETLSQLGGYKRVLNYMKRTDELEVRACRGGPAGQLLSRHRVSTKPQEPPSYGEL